MLLIISKRNSKFILLKLLLNKLLFFMQLVLYGILKLNIRNRILDLKRQINVIKSAWNLLFLLQSAIQTCRCLYKSHCT